MKTKELIKDEELYSGYVHVVRRHDASALRAHLRELGFDFGLIGTTYLQDLMEFIIQKPMRMFYLRRIAMNLVAEKHGRSLDSVERDIRWTIDKARRTGVFEGNESFKKCAPSAKKVVTWILDHYI